MDDDDPPRICETCKRSYTLGFVEMNHMNPPDNYQMGSGTYCLACWLMVGPTDFPESWEEETPLNTDAGDPTGPDVVSDTPMVAVTTAEAAALVEAPAAIEPAAPRRNLRREPRRREEISFPSEDDERLRRSVPEICEMLAFDFGASDAGLWTDFIARFGETQGRICYYPSAGGDFRPLVYQQIMGIENLGLLAADRQVMRQSLFEEIEPPTIRNTYEAPDLWIMSDYRGDQLDAWLESGLIHQDERIEIRILSHTELQPRAHHYKRSPDRRYVSRRRTPLTGRVFYLRLAVTNATIGTVEADVLYFCVENVHLISRFLLSERIPVSHVVWVRDGSALGGGYLRHDFVVHLLPSFQTQWLFVGDSDLRSYSPEKVEWPTELLSIKRALKGAAPVLRVIEGFHSGSDEMVFCEVDNTEPDKALLRHLERERLWLREKAQRSREEVSRRDSGVYLWFSSEGWVKFGPFEWLRFGDDGHTVIAPEGVVASKVGGCWKASGTRWEGWNFHHPMITNRPEHPSPDRGTHP
jgi:hypothetical protein